LWQEDNGNIRKTASIPLRILRRTSPTRPSRAAAGRLEDLTSVVYHSGKSQPKSGAFPWLRFEVDDAAMQLNNAERRSKADSGTVLFGGEVEVEDAIAQLGRNTDA
jgi:hypothetical protein